MRGALITGLVVVLLIIGLLIMKNMAVDNPSGVTETQAKKYIDQAQNAADIAKERIEDIGKRVHGSE